MNNTLTWTPVTVGDWAAFRTTHGGTDYLLRLTDGSDGLAAGWWVSTTVAGAQWTPVAALGRPWESVTASAALAIDPQLEIYRH